MNESSVAKVTISLSRELLEFADNLAREEQTSRSNIIARLLKREEEARIQTLMAEGYQEMAEENQRLAEEVFPLAEEVIAQHTRWDERADA